MQVNLKKTLSNKSQHRTFIKIKGNKTFQIIQVSFQKTANQKRVSKIQSNRTQQRHA